MGLIAQNVRLKPPTMPKAGGAVTFVFEARSTGATTAQKTTYRVSPDFPYVFANATDPANPRVVEGQRTAVTLDPADLSQLLTLQRVAGAATLMVFVKAQVFEVDAKGDPILDGSGQPLPPKPLTGIITVE